jgi:hypothetical protein
MNFCIHDSKIKDYTRPIQGGKNITADSTEKSQTQTFNQGPQVSAQSSYQEFKTQELQYQYQQPTQQYQQPPQQYQQPTQQYQQPPQEQYQPPQEQYQPPQEQSQPIERKHKHLQLQNRSRFQARRRDVRQVDVPPQPPPSPQVQSQPQTQPLAQEIKVDNEFGYSIDE